MTPRLKNSKKWTAFPPDLTAQISSSFKLQFKNESKKGSFKVEGRIFPAEILLRVGYLEKGRLKQSNLEVSVDFKPKDNVVSKIHLCVDALGSLFFDYFEALNAEKAELNKAIDESADETSDDSSDLEPLDQESQDPTVSPGLDLPAVWKAFPFLEETVYIQYSTVNSDLEAEADRLLGLQADALLHEVPEDEEDSVEPELELDPTPKMFGPGRKKNKLH